MKQIYMNPIKASILLFTSFLFFTSCEEDKIITPYQNPTINQITLNFMSSDSTESVDFVYPVIKDTITPTDQIIIPKLKTNTTYTTRLTISNIQQDSTFNISEELKLEKERHQFFYTSDSNIEFSELDLDVNEQIFGLETTAKTLLSSQNTVHIKLIHLPIKSAENVSNNNPTNAGGTIGFDATFNIPIE